MNIQVKNLSFSYSNSIQALEDVSLIIEEGEQVAIVGQNGAGKTTLVRHFNGLLRPSSGEVLIGDWSTKDHEVFELATRVGYVFQNPDDQLFCRTVREEIRYGPQNLKFMSDRIEKLVSAAIQITGLEEKGEINPYDLSPTWRKMVALASILAMDTEIIVLDEPTTSQDAYSIQRIVDIIKTLRMAGRTVITISHDIDFCVENFDRVIVMGRGRILLDGPMASVIPQKEILASTYVELPQLTRLGERLRLDRFISNQAEFIEALREA